jgi:hypothetical protein
MTSPWTSASLASRSIGLLRGTAAGKQLFPRDTGTLSFDLRPQGSSFLFSTLQVGPHFVAVPEIVGNDGVDVGQRQGVVGTHQVFRRHAVLILLDDQVKTDATFADADRTPFIHLEGRRLSAKG